MECAWKELLAIVPPGLRREVDRHPVHLQELRLRLNSPVELVTGQGSVWLEHRTSPEDLSYCVNAASKYSPWAAATMAKGFSAASFRCLMVTLPFLLTNTVASKVRVCTCICL